MRWFTPLKIALLLTALDGLWALQALAAVPRHAGSNVALVGLIVWVVLHLPAAVAVSAVLKAAGVLSHGAEALPAWALGAMALAGLLQTFGLVYGLTRWRRSRA